MPCMASLPLAWVLPLGVREKPVCAKSKILKLPNCKKSFIYRDCRIPRNRLFCGRSLIVSLAIPFGGCIPSRLARGGFPSGGSQVVPIVAQGGALPVGEPSAIPAFTPKPIAGLHTTASASRNDTASNGLVKARRGVSFDPQVIAWTDNLGYRGG